MRRRTLLAALALCPFAGCVAPGTDSATTNDSPTPTVTPDPNDPILFVVRNATDSELTVTLTITRDETAVLNETVTLAADESAEYDPNIGTTGDYTVTVEVDGGPARTLDRSIGRYAVRMGSNHFVDITADSIEIYWEE
ncbi:MAG: hypothetical protein ABEH86_09645 [Haloarcula sp.]